jgi:hypothetical protein
MALLLIAVLVGIVIFVQWHMKATIKDPDLYDYPEPWKEWRVRESSEKPVQEISAEQPAMTEALKYDTNLSEKDSKEPRGELILIIGSEGGVGGNWNGFYHKGRERSFQIMGGGFDGRVFPAKIYCSETGEEDPAKLYLMAKGEFLVQESDSDKGRVNNIFGDIYVRGWLSPDYVLTGEVTITSDEKYFETFTWTSYRPER